MSKKIKKALPIGRVEVNIGVNIFKRIIGIPQK